MNSPIQEIIQFIRKLYKEPIAPIPLHAPVFKGNEKKYLLDCIDSTFVSSVGIYVDRFEDKIAEYTGAKKAVACVNGTSALHLALKLVGVEPNTEVITQPITFVATTNAIKYCGADPVFLDVDRDTMGLSPVALRTWLQESTILKFDAKKKGPVAINKKSGRQITACLPMHTFGFPCRIDEIIDICNQYGIPVVEDAAESLGSYYKDQHTGTFGEIGILSFNGNKIITSGGGGMLLFKDDALAKKAKHLTTQAKVPHTWEFEHDEIGYNYRMPNINAAIGLAQLEQMPKYLESKRQTAEAYEKFFSTLDTKFSFFTPTSYSKPNNWLNCLLLPSRKERDFFLQESNRNGIMTRPVWKLMNEHKMFMNNETGPLENSKLLEDIIINIPSGV